MATLKNFISASPRKTITHFKDMNDESFSSLIDTIKSNKGILKNIPTSLKVDGAGLRFGKNSDGKFFMETSRSGIITEPKSFSNFNKNKKAKEEIVNRSLHYDDVFDLLQASDLWTDLPYNSKIFCEMLYNPMGVENNNSIKFVNIDYNKKFLGKKLTLIILKGDGNLSKLINKSTDEIKLIPAKLGLINYKLNLDYSLPTEELKLSISDQIIETDIPGKYDLGNIIEGLVLEINGQSYKVTSTTFKNLRTLSKRK